MRHHPKNFVRKYSARSMAAGSVFCPACLKLTDRESHTCGSCGFRGEHTMRIFPMPAPPLEMISDHALLFSEEDQGQIRKSLRGLRRQFPQIHWRIVTANLQETDEVGLFAFWLLNVSPPGKDEDVALRPWTILIVMLADGDVAVVPGYSAEVWLSGHAWSKLLQDLSRRVRKKGYGLAMKDFADQAADYFYRSWLKVNARTRRKSVSRVLSS